MIISNILRKSIEQPNWNYQVYWAITRESNTLSEVENNEANEGNKEASYQVYCFLSPFRRFLRVWEGKP